MAETDKFPRLIASDDGGAVEVGDGVVIRWRCGGDGRWRVSVESDSGLDVLDVHQEKAARAVH